MGELRSMVDRWAVEEEELFELDDFDQPDEPDQRAEPVDQPEVEVQ